MEPLISIIVPVYNVESYVRRAVESMLYQTYRNLDIILVDDGSTDGCPAICDAYAQKEERVRVIHKENGGLSDARNAGLEVAKGDYIAFLDSDDYYSPYYIQVLYEKLLWANADVAICGYEITQQLKPENGPDFEREYRKIEDGSCHVEVFDRKQTLLNQYETNHDHATDFIVAWNKLYKASLFQGLTFPKGRIHEDEATTYRYFDRIQKAVYIPAKMYAYFSMPDSITRKKFTRKRLQWVDALDERIQFFEQKKEYDLVLPALRARADGAIRYYAFLTQSEKQIAKEKKRLRMCVRQALRANQKGVGGQTGFLSPVTRLGYHIFLICPPLHRFIVRY